MHSSLWIDFDCDILACGTFSLRFQPYSCHPLSDSWITPGLCDLHITALVTSVLALQDPHQFIPVNFHIACYTFHIHAPQHLPPKLAQLALLKYSWKKELWISYHQLGSVAVYVTVLANTFLFFSIFRYWIVYLEHCDPPVTAQCDNQYCGKLPPSTVSVFFYSSNLTPTQSINHATQRNHEEKQLGPPPIPSRQPLSASQYSNLL